MKLPIYLDYASTTPVDTRVADKMMKFLTKNGVFGNPASRSHFFGWQAEEAINIARNQIARVINVDPQEIIFTSGATESNNLAIKGTSQFFTKKGKHIITSTIEHPSVLDTCNYLEKNGFRITYLKCSNKGIISIDELKSSLSNDTILVSIIHVNNEIGIIQDIASIGEICHKHNIIFHVDASQSICKLPIDLSKLKVDLMSLSSHKIYGPKGIGALYIRKKPYRQIEAQIHGGGHERKIRSGTLPVHQIIGMGEAYRIASECIKEDAIYIKNLRDRFWQGINTLDNVFINGDLDYSIYNIINIRFSNIDIESLILALKDIAISSGSACTSAHLEASYILRALGLSEAMAHNSIRFSIGRFTTEEEIDYSIYLIKKSVSYLSINHLF
ncbi:IscS subfamily cysteine desulfurase [Candidatus Pantoea edessiphila]|uniref:cysteine desulfurase n=1 Tax=Candidatus Pantoea edessiphila TaxID=2044610 RepID=A0A2P5SYE2_9GAMM|nr:IscS subfamily cysteine desulfurase [Candidatus Pantoea edessiphila]MBK4775519.1 IscS subfamily cysteine desulfurase [Pantoea sp. Edef]PPI87354.1 IscS subfamily cysteine desulfurase [Candidatus Pantoea edessiphila]